MNNRTSRAEGFLAISYAGTPGLAGSRRAYVRLYLFRLRVPTRSFMWGLAPDVYIDMCKKRALHLRSQSRCLRGKSPCEASRYVLCHVMPHPLQLGVVVDLEHVPHSSLNRRGPRLVVVFFHSLDQD